MPPEAERLYGRLIEALRRETVKIATERGIEPREVAEAIGTRAHRTPPARRATWWAATPSCAAAAALLLPDRVMDRLVARSLGGSRSSSR